MKYFLIKDILIMKLLTLKVFIINKKVEHVQSQRLHIVSFQTLLSRL
jgi:hypothetical protein